MNRRHFLQLSTAGIMALAQVKNLHGQNTMLKRPIPSTGEMLPVIGLGTAGEYDGNTADSMEDLKAVLQNLLDTGGTLVDTAPTYGNAENVLGKLFSEMNIQQRLFIATKISLTRIPFLSKRNGISQMIESEKLMGKSPLDLIQVHNLNDIDTQWENLLEWKAAGKVSYIGVTIYHYGQYDRMEKFLKETSDVDFVQLNYSILEPRAQERLIPISKDKGAAIIANRPFGNGGYFSKVRGKTLPDWAGEFDCESWAQFSLKWILGNPGITCAIPATSKPGHMLDNARAGYGRLPDQSERQKMLELMQSI